MTEYQGTTKPISVRTMEACCLTSVEVYLKARGSEAEGTVVQCETYPKKPSHRATVTGGKWLGTVVPKKLH